MKYILHIDTSSEKGLIAISGDGKLLYQKINTEARHHASSINLMIEEVLKESSIEFDNLSAVSVIGGPGSYTGLRIGLATAKGLCYVLEKPLLLHNKLDLLALQSYQPNGLYHWYAAILPAREKEYFFTVFNNAQKHIIQPKHGVEEEIEEIFRNQKEKIIITGLGAKKLLHRLTSDIEYVETNDIDIHFWCAKSLEFFDCNRIVNLANSEPFYLKHVYTHKSV